MKIKRIGVFCGSSHGAKKEYSVSARLLGQELARRQIGIVFGAGNVGLMDVAAEAALEGGGEVIGVIPRFMLEMDLARKDLTRLEVTETMHERKAKLYELSDGFIALPGGIGTIEEIIEAFTWNQLELHDKPCALLNVMGFYDHLIEHLDRAREEGFFSAEHRDSLFVGETPEAILEHFERCLAEARSKKSA
ncbi:MAG: LOG family protein [Planctomycetota bacterium]